MVWEAPSLPYYCDPDLLPAPLPTLEDIENALYVFVERSSKVVLVKDHFVVKYGPQRKLRVQEGFNMIFVEQNLTIPKPFVYALFEEAGNAYLIMQYVAGETLDVVWPSLENDEQHAVLRKLKTLVDEMRSLIPPSPAFYGSVDGGAIPNFLFWTKEPQKAINGPFLTEKEFCLGLVEKLSQIHIDNDRHTSRVEWLRKHLPMSLIGHKPTFTHGDLQRKNIRIQKTSSKILDDKDFSLVILDWEDSGWYPEYFEYFLRYVGFSWNDEWPLLIESCLDPFPVETMVLLPLYREIFL